MGAKASHRLEVQLARAESTTPGAPRDLIQPLLKLNAMRCIGAIRTTCAAPETQPAELYPGVLEHQQRHRAIALVDVTTQDGRILVQSKPQIDSGEPGATQLSSPSLV